MARTFSHPSSEITPKIGREKRKEAEERTSVLPEQPDSDGVGTPL